jgi:hypothetical protein
LCFPAEPYVIATHGRGIWEISIANSPAVIRGIVTAGMTYAYVLRLAANPSAGKPSGLTSANYAINFVAGSLTINKAPLTVTANNAV